MIRVTKLRFDPVSAAAAIGFFVLLKTVTAVHPLPLALASFAVELGQNIAATLQWHIPNRALRIAPGSTAD